MNASVLAASATPVAAKLAAPVTPATLACTVCAPAVGPRVHPTCASPSESVSAESAEVLPPPAVTAKWT